MKTLRNFFLFPLLFVSMAAIVFAVILADQYTNQAIAKSDPILTVSEKAPKLVAVVDGSTAALAWTEVDETDQYRMLVSYSHEDSGHNSYEIDMGLNTEFILDLEDQKTLDIFDESIDPGLTFDARVEACDQNGVCRKSNIEYFRIGTDVYGGQNIEKAPKKLSPNNEIPSYVSTQLSFDCSVFVEPARSCVLGTDILIPVGATNPFTASGGTDGFTMSSNNPGVVIGGFETPSQGLGWITGVSEGSTLINIWDGQGCQSAMSVKVLPANGNYVYMSDMNPPPYPYSILPAGEELVFEFRMWFPPVSGRYYKLKYDFGMLGGSSSSNSEEARQIVVNNTQEAEIRANAASSWSQDITVSGTLPYGWDYLVIWLQYLDSDQTTVLAESCQAGWLIDNIVY
jgi:hypothetical protein